jgi:hypothetical protein
MPGQSTVILRACLIAASAAGCTTANGGAVDLSWKLRPQSGATDDPNVPTFLDCSMQGSDGEPLGGSVQCIELQWQVGSDSGFSDFQCVDQHGETLFDLPTGTASLSVVPLCADPTMPKQCVRTRAATVGTYLAPAPVQRQVTVGGTISLGAVELVVDVAPSMADCSTTVSCICD